MPKQKLLSSSELELPEYARRKIRKHLDHVLAACKSAHGYKGEYLLTEVFSKYHDPELYPPSYRRSAAISKWRKTEFKNARVNRHLMLFEGDLGWTDYSVLKQKIRSIIARVLGPVPQWSGLDPEVTNGASTRVRRSPVAAVDKLTGVMHVTQSALAHWEEFSRNNILAALPVTIVDGSVLFTVPKKSDIDRVACKEPECNMILQRMLGKHIASRLRKMANIDLSDQSVNQRLARTAVADGLATIDLSSASDSVSRQIVMELLPAPWWSILDDIRVTGTYIDGTFHKLEMFSSMGNGFTFELESLLFYAITRAVCWLSGIKGKISVYGDDIIAPSAIVPRLRRVLSLFGFTMNPKKTHYKGPFRESCGKHYHCGVDVTPFYIRREVATVPDLILLLNHLLEWDGRGWGFFLNEEPYRFWLKWRKLVPEILWGGLDPSDPSALVTGDKPNHRLVPVTRPMKRDDLGAIRLWLLRKQHTDLSIGIDPEKEVGFTFLPFHSLGERTTWIPDLIWS